MPLIFKAENPICFKKDLGLKIKGAIEASACYFIPIFKWKKVNRNPELFTQIVQ